MHVHRGGRLTRLCFALCVAFAKAGVLRAETNARDPTTVATSVAVVDGNDAVSVVCAGIDTNVPSVLAADGVTVVNVNNNSNVAASTVAVVDVDHQVLLAETNAYEPSKMLKVMTSVRG